MEEITNTFINLQGFRFIFSWGLSLLPGALKKHNFFLSLRAFTSLSPRGEYSYLIDINRLAFKFLIEYQIAAPTIDKNHRPRAEFS